MDYVKQMKNKSSKQLQRYEVSAMPILFKFIGQIGLREILLDYLPPHGNEKIATVDTLLFLICNLALGKHPLYKLDKWMASLDVNVLGYDQVKQVRFTDDRFGRALDKLYQVDRSSLMTEIVLTMVDKFNIDLKQIHNDSTTVKAFGKIPGKTKSGLELKKGHSKDHRPDLKQLVFNITLSRDGGVPIHYKTYSGNRTDNTIYLETWKRLKDICQDPNFLYVADSKLCSDEQLTYITEHGGRAITIIPETWQEVSLFKNKLRDTIIPKKEIYRRIKPGTIDEQEYFSVYQGRHFTKKRHYQIHWIYSSEKRNRDRLLREEKLRKADNRLTELLCKINKRHLKTYESIKTEVDNILNAKGVAHLVKVDIRTAKYGEKKQNGKGRPTKNTQYQINTFELYTMTWNRDPIALKKETKLDGLFPLLSTDHALSSKDVLLAYKYQPNIEKRFSQFKHYHHAAPLLFKNITRVEANMFLFFIALILRALIEREIREKMKLKKIYNIDVYPENRSCSAPTANVIFELFESIATYQLSIDNEIIESFCDKLDATQLLVLDLLGMVESSYWKLSKSAYS